MQFIKKNKILLIIILIISAFFISSKSYSSLINDDTCKNPTQIEDYTDRDIRLTICKDLIKYGDTTVVRKEDDPELFEYRLNDKEIWNVTHEVVVYKINNNEYIAIFPVVNPQSWYKRSGYIFQKSDDSFKLIFKRDFDSLSGRWTGVRFDENGSVFDPNVLIVNQDFGALGPDGQRIRWTDYYIWNEIKKNYELANNKMSFRFTEIRNAYDEIDLNACGNESPELKGSKISDLYTIRQNNEHFCDDESPVPYISNEQAEMFLKAKKALVEINQGKNHSFNNIERMDI